MQVNGMLYKKLPYLVLFKKFRDQNALNHRMLAGQEANFATNSLDKCAIELKEYNILFSKILESE